MATVRPSILPRTPGTKLPPQPQYQPSSGVGRVGDYLNTSGMPNAPANYAGSGVYRETGQAPPGYAWDPTQGTYLPIQQSPAWQLEQRRKDEEQAAQDRGMQLRREGEAQAQAEAARQQEQSRYDVAQGQQYQAQQALRSFAGGAGGGGYSPGGGGSYSPSGGVPAPVSYPGATQGGAAAPDPQAAQRAAFSAAKSRAGSLARSSLESLRGELAERGILGGGTEARGIADTIFQGAGPLSDLNVAQQGEELDIAKRGRELGEQRATTQYQGGITMRGQDIGAQQANEARRLQAVLASLRGLY